MIALVIALALLLDWVAGEPPRWHPLVGYGRLVLWVEDRILDNDSTASRQRTTGTVAVVLMVMVPAVLLGAFERYFFGALLSAIVSIVVLYIAIGARSLVEHAQTVGHALAAGDLGSARTRTARIVSRDTGAMDENGVVKATVESILENGSDALFAPIFWFTVAGIPGVVVYRLSNTLDAMWGYRNDRYRYFGWAAARMDDLLNWLPARLAALSYALMGNFSNAIRCWRRQARNCESPNAGPVMAAGAGAINVEIGGDAIYQGQIRHRPILGAGHSAEIEDIGAALALVQRTAMSWLIAIALLTLVATQYR